MTPGELAWLTDWQVEHLYRRPQAERAEQLRREAGAGRPPEPSAGPPPPPPRRLPDREAALHAMVGVLGMDPAAAARDYDRAAAGG